MDAESAGPKPVEDPGSSISFQAAQLDVVSKLKHNFIILLRPRLQGYMREWSQVKDNI